MKRFIMMVLLVMLLAVAGWQAYNEYRVHYAWRIQSEPQPSTASSQARQFEPQPATDSYQTRQFEPQPATDSRQVWAQPAASQSHTPTDTYQCDGRTHCSQMTSCAEATYFLRNCPGVKMDGDHDGIPCENQWCRG